MLVENDSDVNPTIPRTQLTYILHLSDAHTAYTRFFDALLIRRPSHCSFFNDLCGFRSQPIIVSLLSSCNSSDSTISKEDLRQKYREVTRHYLSSRFAHPWCRTALSVPSTPTRPSTSGTSGTGSRTAKGWWSAEWGSTGRKISKKDAEEEARLHKLLVPIWITMRARMFPGDQTVQRWWDTKKEDEERIRKVREMETEMRQELEKEREHERVDSDKVIKWLEKLDTENLDPVDLNGDIGHNDNEDDMEDTDFELSPTSTLSISIPSSSTTTLNETEALADDHKVNLNLNPYNKDCILSSPKQSVPAITVTLPESATDTVINLDSSATQHTTTTTAISTFDSKPRSTTKATPDDILHPLRATKTTPNLRETFWSSPEAYGLAQELSQRDQPERKQRSQQKQQSRRPRTGTSTNKSKHKYQYHVPGYDSDSDTDYYYNDNYPYKYRSRYGSGSVHEGEIASEASAIATGLMKVAAVGMLLTTMPKWKVNRLMKKVGQAS